MTHLYRKSLSRMFGAAAGFFAALWCVCLLAQPPRAEALVEDQTQAKEEKPTKFLRVLRGSAEEPIAMETAIVRYASPDGKLTVDLVAAVHIADALYYSKLNRTFDEYDVVLYELVAPEGMERPEKGRRSDNPLAMIQKLMTVGLGLELQLDKVDYSKPHFVHADMSPEEMAEAMEKRGDNVLTVALGAVADMIRQYNLKQQKAENGEEVLEAPEVDPLSLLLDPDGPKKMKRALAEQFASTNIAGGEGLGKTLTTLLVNDRNGACMKVLHDQVAGGKKKVAIFYGAAHMPDFEKRLKKELGLKRQNVTWLTAWDLERRGGGGLLRLLEQ